MFSVSKNEQHRTLGSDTPALSGVRTFIVPPDIVAVPRRSPVPVRKRTPWTPRPDGEDPVDRTGGRDWFGERLSSHAARPRSSGIFAASAVVNAAAVLLVAVLMMSRRDVSVPGPHQPLYVRVALALGSPVAPETTAPAPPQAAPLAPASAPAPKAEEPAVAIESTPAAPVEAPAEIRPEPLPRTTGRLDPRSVCPMAAPTARRRELMAQTAEAARPPDGGADATGRGIQPPKKVKDVKPVYPPDAMSGQLRGTVRDRSHDQRRGPVVNAVSAEPSRASIRRRSRRCGNGNTNPPD